MRTNRDTCVRVLCCLAELECVTNPVEFGWVELETTSKDVVFSCRSRRGHHFSVHRNIDQCSH